MKWKYLEKSDQKASLWSGMSDNDNNYITPQGLKKLKDEYHQLMHVDRPKTVEIVAWAASNGDRSENADYIYGKRRLREIDSRVRFLTSRLEKAIVVDPPTLRDGPNSSKVIFGATVTVEDEEGQSKTFQIIGEDEWNIENSKISWKSPMAKAMLGRRVDDEVIVKKPSGEESLTITKIEYK
jgi:transcription elongation factor GreB